MSPFLTQRRQRKHTIFLKVVWKLPFPSVTLVDPLVDKLAEVEVESLGVKLVTVNAETLSKKTLDGEIAEVEFEKRSVTKVLVNAETLGIALAVKLEELVIELLVMTLAGEESKTFGTELVDKLADEEAESLSVEMIGETKALGDSLVDKLELLEVKLLGATITGVETEVIDDFLPDKVAEAIEVLGAIIAALETETLDDALVDKLTGEKAK